MNPLKRFIQTIIVFVVAYIVTGLAWSRYKGETFDLPKDWPLLVAAITAGAAFRLYHDRQAQ